MRSSGKKYFEIKEEGLLTKMIVGRDGLWAMKYDRPASQRSKEVSLGKGIGNRLIVFKPLFAGGAHRLEYNGYQLVEEHEIDEAEFQENKTEIEREYLKTWDVNN